MLDYEILEPSEISNDQLEIIIKQKPSLIKEGLKYVASHRAIIGGPTYLLLLDEYNVLVIVILKSTGNAEMLFQALDYYDHVYLHLVRIAMEYKTNELQIDPYQEPRMILIAPEFSSTLVNRTKWIRPDIELYSYRYLNVKNEGVEVGKLLDFIPVHIPMWPNHEEIYTVSEALDFINVSDLKKAAYDLIDELKKWENIRIVPHSIDFISIQIKENVSIYLNLHKNSFDLELYRLGFELQHISTVKSPDDLKEAISATKKVYDDLIQNNKKIAD